MKPARAQAKASVAKAPARSTSAPSPERMGATELTSIQSSLTGGAPLPASTRSRLETSFGTSLSDVRVHTGGAAASATDRLQADAFASGSNIAFAPGRFAPGTRSGDHLIAEEVAHVIQQRGAGGQVSQPGGRVSSPTETAETSARAAADQVVAGKPARLSLTGLSTRGRIMRRARASAIAKSPVVAAPTSVLGTTKTGSAPVLTPTMTSTLSPAGGKLVDSAARRQTGRDSSNKDTAAKAPDEAQTALGQEAAGPPNVTTAGSPAGANAEGSGADTSAPKKNGANGSSRDKDKKRQGDNKEKKKRDPTQRAGGGAAGGAGGGGGRFGQVTGDRGEAAAEEARRRLDQRAQSLSTNEGADARISAAQAAAQPASNAAQAAGQQSQTGMLEQADVPAGDPAAARAASRSAVAAATPGNIEDLENFASSGGAARRRPLTDAIAGQADAQTGPVRTTLSAVDRPPLGPAPPAALPQPEPMSAPGSADPALSAAVPPPINDDALDASEFEADADAALAEHDVDDETLNRSDEGPLREIGNDKTQLGDKVNQAADRARATESQARDTARGSLGGVQAGAQSQMAGQRTGGQASVSAEQDATRIGQEQGEQSLADTINTTYQAAQTEVNGKLATLTQDSVATFRERQGARLEGFASGVRTDLADLKRRRYSGIRGRARRVRDWFLSINSVPAVRRLYQRHRDQYIADIDALITQIKADIDRTIAECKQALKTAREAIEKLVTDNAGALDAEATAALNRARSGFQEMERQIDQAAAAAARALDSERRRAIDAMDRELDSIRAENAGLVDRIANAVAALAAALGQFMRLMTRVTRMGIGAFVSAAMSQAGDGMRNNLWGQLQEAFKQWIFMKLPILQVLLSLPPNWHEMLTTLSMNMIGVFMENLPAMLPSIGVAVGIWLATTLAAKFIPGVGAIMAVIDAIRGAYALIQSMFSAASAFFEFVMQVANRGNGAVAFARAIAFGIVAAIDAVLTFLGVDRLIRRIIGAIGRPFARIARRIASRFGALMRRMRRRRRRGRRRDRRRRMQGGGNQRRRARSRARTRRRSRRRRRAQRRRRRDRTRRQPRRNRSDRRRDRARRRRERMMRRWRRGLAALRRGLRRDADGAGMRPMVRRAWLALLRIRYRFRELRLFESGGRFRVRARMNPGAVLNDGDVISIRRVRPQWPSGLRPASAYPSRARRFAPSRRSGNIRLRAYDNPRDVAKQYRFAIGTGNPHHGRWIFESVNQLGRRGEQLVRQKLAADTPQYLSFLNGQHAVNAPGFDQAGSRASGARSRGGSATARVEVGEVKTSRATGYHPADKFTAITGNFGTNMDDTLQGLSGRVARNARSAVRSGNIDFVVYLVGGARVSSVQRVLLQRRILNAVRAYLRANGLTRREASQAARNVTVSYQSVALT